MSRRIFTIGISHKKKPTHFGDVGFLSVFYPENARSGVDNRTFNQLCWLMLFDLITPTQNNCECRLKFSTLFRPKSVTLPNRLLVACLKILYHAVTIQGQKLRWKVWFGMPCWHLSFFLAPSCIFPSFLSPVHIWNSLASGEAWWKIAKDHGVYLWKGLGRWLSRGSTFFFFFLLNRLKWHRTEIWTWEL